MRTTSSYSISKFAHKGDEAASVTPIIISCDSHEHNSTNQSHAPPKQQYRPSTNGFVGVQNSQSNHTIKSDFSLDALDVSSTDTTGEIMNPHGQGQLKMSCACCCTYLGDAPSEAFQLDSLLRFTSLPDTPGTHFNVTIFKISSISNSHFWISWREVGGSGRRLRSYSFLTHRGAVRLRDRNCHQRRPSRYAKLTPK
jgi:hypothetical protein